MMTKRDLFNAKNSGKKIEEGMEITIKSVGQFQDKDKDGHEVTVTAMVDETGDVYTTISATVGNSIDLLEDILADEGQVTVKVIKNTSNGGREFYQLQII